MEATDFISSPLKRKFSLRGNYCVGSRAMEVVHRVKSRTHAQDHKHCEPDLKGSKLAGESSARKHVHILLSKSDS